MCWINIRSILAMSLFDENFEIIKEAHPLKRITDRNPKKYMKKVCVAYKKLQKLENIEEELGIDLITLFKALKDGIYIKTNDDMGKSIILKRDCKIGFNGYQFIFIITNPYELKLPKNYGKTWSLTRKELENENR